MNFLARWIPQLSPSTWIRIGIGLAVVLAVLLNEADFVQFRFLQQLELWAYDTRLRQTMPKTPDPRIVILDIDEKSLSAEGHWPWSRNKLATMVRQLFERYNVAVVGFDVAFAEADDSSGLSNLEALRNNELKNNTEFQAFMQRSRESLDYDQLFANEIAKHPVVLGFFLGNKPVNAGALPAPSLNAEDLKGAQLTHIAADGYSGNIKVLQDAATAAGHLYPSLDFDGVTRRVPMLMRYGDGFYEAISLAVVRTYLGNVPLQLKLDVLSGNVYTISALQLGDLRIPLDEAISALIPYRGERGVFRYISATDVIRGTLGPDELKDKIVIVGTSAQGLLDLRSTPVREDFPGVEVHANLISGFLDGRVMHRPAEVWAISVLTVLFLGIPFAIVLPRVSAVAATGMMAGFVALIVGVNLIAWHYWHYVLNIAAPLLMLLVLYFLNMAYGFFAEARSRRLITGLFGTYVPKELVEQMSKNPEEYSMRGESRQMSVLFSDVRDFTTISEGLTAEQLKDLMNAYLTAMTEEIQAKSGTIDKYIGDAIMAFWGAPVSDAEHARHGLEAALAMQTRIRKLDSDFVKRGWPVLHIGVGLNCGEMSVGDMGSKFRRAYTVMGDAVNLASRLEGLTKEYGVRILVSETIVHTAPGFVYREVDKVQVKGRMEGVGIYEPLGREGEVNDDVIGEVFLFHKALEHYRAQRWEDAEQILADLASNAPDMKLYKVFRERVLQFRFNPPGAGWNGVWVFKTK